MLENIPRVLEIVQFVVLNDTRRQFIVPRPGDCVTAFTFRALNASRFFIFYSLIIICRKSKVELSIFAKCLHFLVVKKNRCPCAKDGFIATY